MDAVAIEESRPKASLMLKRLRANMANQEGGKDSYNKYRMRSDDELTSVYTEETGEGSEFSGSASGSASSGQMEDEEVLY